MNTENLIKELKFKAIRSSGAGGQHVNKTSSKIELTFNISDSKVLSEKQKEVLYKNLSTRVTKAKTLIFFTDQSRSQHRNKQIAIKHFLEVLSKGLYVTKNRKVTKPSKASVRKKAENKRKHAFKKHLRKKPKLE